MTNLAGLGITIPPQLALAGTAGTGTIPLTGFGALARQHNHAPAGWDNAFQFGMHFAGMQLQCQQMTQRMDMMQASTMQDSSKPTCDSDTGTLKQEGLLK